MNHMFVMLTVLAYLLSMGLYMSFLYTGKEVTGRLATALMFMSLACHYLALLGRARAMHSVPYHDLQGSMSLFGWLLAVTYLCLEIYHRQRTVGAFVVPIILAFFLAGSLAPEHPAPPTEAHGVVFALHVTLSILAYAGFALSCVLSLMFLGEERLLRMRKVGDVVWRLPSLELLERMSHTSVLVGTCHHRRWHSSRIYRGGSPGRPALVFRPQIYCHAGGAASVPRLFPVGADHGLERRACLQIVCF